jgi:hypothetical protein
MFSFPLGGSTVLRNWDDDVAMMIFKLETGMGIMRP